MCIRDRHHSSLRDSYYCFLREQKKKMCIRDRIKALRHYDEIGLLKPAYVDEHNGYRYYSSSQLPILHRILVLRQIGFRLDEIQQILSGANETGMLLMKKRDVYKRQS